jgi:hypothetical protein
MWLIQPHVATATAAACAAAANHFVEINPTVFGWCSIYHPYEYSVVKEIEFKA